ncbi:hypothetical protein F4808DRAFT_449427 [Astrocystis sublimbata]|nr:hypothetical protein F4808DRAFT_449427 [Astrocystis sublimbata]
MVEFTGSALAALRTSLFSSCLITLSYPSFVSAVQIYDADSLPTDISSGCLDAMTVDVPDCLSFASSFRYGYFYSERLLGDTCTSECSSGLAAFEKGVISACSNDTYLQDGDTGDELPMALMPNIMRYLYELSCIKDNGRFCNVVAGTNAALSDPGSGSNNWLGGVDNDTTAASACDLCFVNNLRMQAGSPYYDGPEVASQSIYESKTSSCRVSNMPRTTWAMPTTLSDLPAPTASACAGKTYQIQPGDDCHSISKSQGIGTSWLLMDNNLGSFCSDFPTKGSLCLTNTCSVYTVKANDTCKAIAKASELSQAQLIKWNPQLSAACGNIDRFVGDQLCIGVPGTPYKDPASTTLAPTSATEPVPVPTDIAEGVNTRCGRYYQVLPDEYCNLITLHWGISLEDFRFLNPGINANCTNLYAYESYCVQPVGDINTYSGRPGATTVRPTGTVAFTAITTLDPVSTGAPIFSSTALPLAPETREDCARYFVGEMMLSENITGTSYGNACEFAAAVWVVDLEDLERWNPDLGNLTSGECKMDPKVRYCAKNVFADPPPDPVGPGYEFEIREGATEDCTQFADAYPDWTCDDILANYALTIAQFYEYNPIVGKDCGNLWPSYAYCIRAPDYVRPDATGTTTTKAPTTTPTAGPPGPTHSGQPTNCNRWHVVEDGDGCDTIEAEYDITPDQFFAWNPAVSKDCLTNFWLGSAYCVGVGVGGGGGSTPTKTTDNPSVPTPTLPSPMQEGNAADDCNAYAQAQDGDCFWGTYWYCIGVAEVQ